MNKRVLKTFTMIVILLGLTCASSINAFADTSSSVIPNLHCDVEDGGYYNTDRIINFTYPNRDDIVATVNSPNDTQDGELKADFAAHEEGEYILTFQVGKTTQNISFVLDKTPPVIKIGSKTFRNTTIGNIPVDGGTFKLGISPEVYDEMTSAKVTISKNGGEAKDFYSGFLLDEVAYYTIYAIDKASNVKVVNFYIEDVNPVISLVAYNTDVTTRPITVYASVSEGLFSSTGIFATGLPIQAVTTDGTLAVKFDTSYNGSQKLTQTIPVTTFSNIKLVSKNAAYAAVDTNIDNKIYKETDEVRISVPSGATATVDGKAITSGTVYTEGGDHVLIITDGIVTNTVRFSIDKMAPTILGAAQKIYYNVDKHVYVLGGYATYSINSEEQGQLTAGTNASEDGHYIITAFDFAGNTSVLEFDIDRTPPTVDDTVGSGGMVFSMGSITKYTSGRYIDITSDKSINLVKVNGIQKSLHDNCYLNAYNGSATTYYITAEDKAGNILYFTVILDNRGTSVTGVENNGVYSTSKMILFENCTATLRYSSKGDYDAVSVNAVAIKSGYEASADGYYIVTTTDSSKNTNTVHFKIDKNPPIVKYNAVAFTGGSFNTPSMSLDVTGDTNTTLLKFGVAVPDWNKNKSITEEGKYELNVTDEVNKLNIQFTIDRTQPIVEGVLEGWTYNVPVIVSYADVLTSVSANLNGKSFAPGIIDTNGKYTLVVTDSAGNSTTRNFTMAIPGGGSQTTPTPTPDPTDIPKILGVIDGKVYNTSITPQIPDGSVLLNGEIYMLGTVISEEGDYTLDVFGTKGGMNSVSFSIDKTAPTISAKVLNGKAFKSGAKIRGTVKVIVSEENPATVTVTKNGKNASFGTGVFKFKAKYVITAVDQAGNKKIFTFTIQ